MADELKILLQAVQDAGNEILNIQKSKLIISRKSNYDIVTQADLLANDILKDQLLNHFPKDGWLSEESVDDLQRLTAKRTWIVDPIDGTREFAKGIPECSISVALVEQHVPIIACVYNPLKLELYYAIKNQGAWFRQKQIYCKGVANNKLIILSSRTEYTSDKWQQLASLHTVKPIGSIAYKLALVASGYAPVCVSLSQKNDWDIAAGALLISEAQGVLTNKLGEKIKFNQKNTKINGIIASAYENYEYVLSIVKNK